MIAGVGYREGSVGGHLTDLNIWLFSRSEEATNLIPRAFPFLSLGRREKALGSAGRFWLLIGKMHF
jgi:hypothetical protein